MNVYTPEGTRIRTNKNREYLSSVQGLEKALEKQIILEAHPVLCDKDMTLHIPLCAGMRGIMRRDEVEFLKDGERSKDIAILTRVGKAICFKVVGFEYDKDGRRIAVLSRRLAQIDCVINYTSALVAGDVIPARVTHLEQFGAFVDIGCGIISLLSIDAISVSRIAHPSERLEVGENIFTVVKSIDERGRIFVSQKELLGTWEENAAEFSEGQTVRGIVRSIESYGIFIELLPNLAGLAEYKEGVRRGQVAAVYIKSIIPEKMKVKLVIIDALDESAQRISAKYYTDPEKRSHIDRWIYSPECSKKTIESVF